VAGKSTIFSKTVEAQPRRYTVCRGLTSTLFKFRVHPGQARRIFPPAFGFIVALSLLCLAGGGGICAQAAPGADPGANELRAGFRSPPASARAKTWWHWMSGCVSREGITADLEAFQKAGLGGVFLFHVGQQPLDGPVKFGSDAWWRLMRFAASEADRLKLEFGFHNCPGWSSSGGPWIPVEKSMQKVVWSEQSVAGPGRFEAALAQPRVDAQWNFYRDIAVLAVPDRSNAVAVSEIVDLSSKLEPSGKLDWEAPPGAWRVLRLGRTTTGKNCHPAPPGAEGLECDKLDREGVDAHFDGYVAKVLTNAGAATGRSRRGVFIDSYEVGNQDWSPGFREEFAKRRGYDPVPWLATLSTNGTVGDAEMTRRFQQDWKRTIAELFADNYYGYMAERVHQYRGCQLGTEPYGGPFDTLAVGARGDEVMAEFWQPPMTWGWDTLKPVASSAHTAGIRVVGAEAFTGDPLHARWQQDPYALKAVGDRAFCLGVNQLILHTSAHQPWTNAWPGMTMGWWGTHFGRTQTWWHQASGWLNYLARCQFLLQQGQFVGDVCCLHPGGGPAWRQLPPGYDGDACSEELFLKSMTVADGRLALPSGMTYRVLVLPARDSILPAVARKVRDLVNAGATVIGPRPKASPSLQDYPACDGEVQAIAAELWDSGRVISGKPIGAVLAGLNVMPDFQADATNVLWIHRRIGNAEVYFVSNPDAAERVVNCTFRVAGRQPEFWDAMTGEIRDAGNYSAEGERTRVPVRLEPRGSLFVVFQKPARGATGRTDWPEFRPVQTLDGAWAVHFDSRWGGPGKVSFEALDDWSQRREPGIRYYSGTAVYEKEFPGLKQARDTRYFLDLGRVKNLAEVRLNGRSLGTVWKPPFRVETTQALRRGKNKLEIRVTNLWPNRLIGDEQQPDDCVWDYAWKWDAAGTNVPAGQPLKEVPSWLGDGKARPSAGRYTLTTWKFYAKDDPLLESGLLGPVRLLSAAE
jgi:hypothetical protein